MQCLKPSPAEQCTLGNTSVLRPLGTEVVTRAVRCGCPDQLRQRLGQAPPALLALAQRLFSAFALGNVPRQGHKETSATLPERLSSDLHWKDRSILASVSGFKRHQLSVVEPPLEYIQKSRSDIRVE